MREIKGVDDESRKRGHKVESRDTPLIIGVLIGLSVVLVLCIVVNYWI